MSDVHRFSLESSWRHILDEIGGRAGAIRSDDRALSAAVRAVSEQYNHRQFSIRWTPAALGARLHFFLPRDQAKIAASIRDIPPSAWTDGAPVRVLDVGCGIGASALGLVRGLRLRGLRGRVDIDLYDADPLATKLASDLINGLPDVTCRALSRVGAERYDWIVLGQVLVEIAGNVSEAASVDRIFRCVRELREQNLAPGGKIIIVEPALREATRRLQALRDRVLAEGLAHVLAPCTHQGACSMLQNPKDWCHDDLDVDLPDWLHATARAAGLRWQGLTFSRLVLSDTPTARPPFRVVAPPRDTKGKTERLLCGDHPDGSRLKWVDRLERQRTETNAEWDVLARGDGVALASGTIRVGPETMVKRSP